MTISDRLENMSSPGTTGSDRRYIQQTPEEWRPRLDVDESRGGFIVSKPSPAGQLPDTKSILEDFGLDPNAWAVSSLRRSRWQVYSGEWLESVRVNLLPVGVEQADRLDAEKLIDEVKKWRPRRGIKTFTGQGAYGVFPSDQQIGKKTGSGGNKESIDRLLNLTEQSVERFKGLQKLGLNLGTIVLGLPGDHVEGNTSQGGRLQSVSASDLGLTEQVRVARRLLMAQIKALAPYCERLIVPVVNGNHDEVSRQVATDPADGWNVEIASAVQDACAENPALSHVEFRFPSSGHQTLTVAVNGPLLGIFHGHQATQNNVLKYLSQQSAGQTALGGADIWVSGHYHNFRSMDIGERLWIQCPTTDPGSDWFRDRAGLESKPGLLTLVFGGDYDPRENISVIPVRL